jgi:hypothetical protein
VVVPGHLFDGSLLRHSLGALFSQHLQISLANCDRESGGVLADIYQILLLQKLVPPPPCQPHLQ